MNHSHLSYLENGRGWTQNKRWYSARGAAPRAIQSKDCDPPPFVRPQSIRVPEQQSRAGGGMGGQGGPELADGLRSRHISLLPQWQYYRCVPLPQRCLTLRGSQTRPVATIPEISPLALSSLSVFASRFCTFTDVSACPYMVDEDE